MRPLFRVGGVLDSFRHMTWLTAKRARLAAGLLLCGAIGLLLLSWHHGLDKAGVPAAHDFSCFWVAARLASAGPGLASYDPEMLWTAEQAVYPPGGYEAFYYPPVFLMFCLPFAGLPYFPALAAYLATTGTMLGAALLRAGRSAWLLAAGFAFPPVIATLQAGQNGMLTAALLGGGLTLLDRRPRVAGLILGGLVVKPHLALAIPLALLATRRWTVLSYGAASGAALVILSSLLFGWQIWPAFLAASSQARDWLEQGSVDPENRFLGVFAFARWQGGSAALAYGAQALFAAGVALALDRALRRRPSPAQEKSMIVLACLLMTPFLWPYDLTALAFPLAWLLAEGAEAGFPPWGKLFLLLGYVVPAPAIAAAGGMAPTSLGLLCLFGYLLWMPRALSRGPEPAMASVDKILTASAPS